MKNTFKIKSLAAIVALFLVSLSASAQFSGGNGTENNPYIITTPAQLAQLATLVNEGNTDYNDKHYKLGNDLDLSEYGENFNDGAGWIPIGWYDYYTDTFITFKGVFDGNNKIITSLYISNTSFTDIGLFGVLDEGIIKNLGVMDVEVNDNNTYAWSPCVGGLVGYNLDGLVLNCYITGSISSSENAGGVVGFNSGRISNCHSSGKVSAISNNSVKAGGIVGRNHGLISNCYSTSLINSSTIGSSCAGGITGYSLDDLTNCYSTGSVTATSSNSDYSYAGGIIGYNYHSSISNCYSTGLINSSSSISVNSCAGGIIGYNYYGSVSNCYSTGLVNSSAYDTSFAGGIVGTNSSSFGTVSNCAALNPFINCIGTTIYFGRIAGRLTETLINNIAFNNMINPDGNANWYNIGEDQIDGEDITIEEIHSDGTLGGRFTTENGWTTQNGKLPGLFGQTVDMPEHLILTGISNNPLSQTLTAFIQNRTLYISGLIPDEKWYIYSISGIMVYEDIAVTHSVETRNALSPQLPIGIYIIKSGTKTTKIIIK